ncbi:CHAT domain-containing protein [Caballeronia sp. J97]|uniref:CHAT domain-containing protein n=1 Tax=Caballeronia sp. J97 TaxID=2805429 RepID=UPI002AAF809F|nr:CHAT domain-containing protein [Caballeronia sp. J97]
MSDTFVLQIRALEDAGSYHVCLMHRDAQGQVHTLEHGIPCVMTLPETEVARLEKVLPDTGVSPSGLPKEGLQLYERLPAAIRGRIEPFLIKRQTTILLDIADRAMQRIPWEIMMWRRPLADGEQCESIARANHISRAFKPDWSWSSPLTRGPLRVLIAIGAANDVKVEAKAEEEAIRRVVQPVQRTIDLEPITPATREELYAKIVEFKPHVFHFIGHGSNDPSYLKFDNFIWDGGLISSDIGNVETDGWLPYLVFLNGCRTANPAGKNASLAAAFMDSARAVIAMQGDIKGEAAGNLAGAFYKRIAEGMPVNEALSAARNGIGYIGGANGKQASFPALTTRCLPAVVLPQFFSPDASYSNRAKNCRLLSSLPAFVNQTSNRRALCRSFWPFQERENEDHFVVVRGSPGYGKSLLCAWLLDLALRVGHRVRYVQLADEPGGVSCARVLELIWKFKFAGVGSPLADPLPPLPGHLDALVTDEQPLDAGSYREFLLQLQEISANTPVTIVLDQLRQKLDFGGFWMLWEHLFVPLSNGDLPNVHLILALSDEDFEHYDIPREPVRRPALDIPYGQVNLQAIARREFLDRFPEYVLHRSNDVELSRMAGDWVHKIAGNEPSFPISYFNIKYKQLHELVTPHS